MSKRNLEATAIDLIFRETLGALKNAREAMSSIAESARLEQDRLKKSALDSKKELGESAAAVDRLEGMAEEARRRLARAIQDSERFSKEAIREAYEASLAAEVELAVERERERALRAKRAELETSLLSIEKMVERAEGMIAQVSEAVSLLAGNLERMADQWEGIKARFQIGERVIRAQEEERRRVAREIHDGPAQAMANVVLRAEICERMHAAGQSEVTQELSQLKFLVKESLRELRAIIFNLRPMALDDLGLIPTLNRYLENLRAHEGCPVAFRVVGREMRLNSMLEVAIFRLVQEAVNNARKYAQASLIQVEIEFEDDRHVAIRVEDDGVGFDMDRLRVEWADRESFGLMSMKERIELLGGEFDVRSVLGEGTRVAARLPYGDEQAPREQG